MQTKFNSANQTGSDFTKQKLTWQQKKKKKNVYKLSELCPGEVIGRHREHTVAQVTSGVKTEGCMVDEKK